MKLFLPKEFTINGQKIKVKYDNSLHECMGESNSELNYIKIKNQYDGHPYPIEQMFRTLLHELLHLMYYKMGFSATAKNEEFIEGSAGILLEILKTMK